MESEKRRPRAIRKPDSSYSSNRLTRNIQGRHLLSTFNLDPREERSLRSDSKGSDKPTSSPTDATFDHEPLSSQSGDGDGDGLETDDSTDELAPTPRRKTLEERLATDNGETTASTEPASSNGKESGSKKGDPTRESGKQNLTQTNRTAKRKAEEEEELFSSFSRSQSIKRQRSRKYGDRKATASFSSSLPSESASPQFKHPRSIPSALRQRKEEEEDDHSFKMPIEFEPPRRTKAADKAKGDSQVATDDLSDHEFKQPLALHDTVSSSSVTVSTKNTQQYLDHFDFSSSLSPLSSPPSSSGIEDDIISKTGDDDNDTSDLPADEPRCPSCKEIVNRDMLVDFLAQPRQRIRDRQRFCESHKKASAEREWKEKGFPTIDWDTFDERIRAHFDDLESLLVPDSTSYYRNILDSALKEGKAKNFRLSLSGDGLETISCGYYGSRGASKMLHAVTTRFSRKLRRLAASDRIVKGAGVAGYAQSVLVPELTIRLVKEDMNVGDEKARQILRETITLGEQVNFALDDVIQIPAEEDPGTIIDG
ncbi:hypothetical protein ASPZODRAFT_131255 [Penicilliopsis zonata CBS 506.65]|uniref:Restriction of telomere capping protein 4 n=1 Tax=Penicilliopsis zonata CBS 506.65 TaxID=1073090 RepID=A0A1L9SKD6_9EURO|nr:hypothetical protein ASPZODRAFT_131255 [Penicilliopsis zonata CBS 506.65]OJJ47699.1 hypothetical protein ASPZODRAFT_131255 [Penicilliopsis zonata CBS 506.65]